MFLLTAQDAALPRQPAAGIAAAAAKMEAESQDTTMDDVDGEVNSFYPDIIVPLLSFVL
jgi:hypothetical protein